MNDCPLVRALGKIVQDDNKPFVWIPGELPFGKSKDVVQIAADESQIIQADRVEDGVPIFKEVVQLHSTTLAFPASKTDRGAEPEGESSAAPPASEVADESEEEAGGREEELLRESMSLRHRLCHMPIHSVRHADVRGCTSVALFALVQILSLNVVCFRLLMHLAKG